MEVKQWVPIVPLPLAQLTTPPGELKWHLKNYNCRAIFLGGSHDNGYARVLKELAAREPAEELAKIQLLEGPPFSRELTDLPYPKVKYANVFSPEKFDAYQQARGAAFGPPPGLATPIGTKRNSQSNGFPALGTGGSAAAPGSYAAAVITAPANPPTASNTSAARGSPKQTKAKIVSAEQNINDAVKRIKTLQPKPCNNFYLKGDCPYHWNDQCKFGHDYPLNPDELEAMRLLARTKQCTWGDRCINEKCYYSHDAE